MNLFKEYFENFQKNKIETLSIMDWLEEAKTDKMLYAHASERMLKAIGDPIIVDTSEDSRLSRIFLNKTLKIYPAFSDFFGMEEVLEKLVGYFTHAAQGLEEKKQVLYLLGPVGGGKSSLSERLKLLMEKYPIYTLAIEKDGSVEMSPVFESPLGLFDPVKWGDVLEKEFNIEKRYIPGIMSPWAQKRLDELDGDISKFKVVKVFPSRIKQIGVVKTEPGDENNQDISSLVGKVDLRKLDTFSQNDTDAYQYSGALCRGNQGLVEFVEMFKAPIKTLHPLLTATQEGNYTGTEEIGAIPFNGVILAHSNESEWQAFKGNKNNEAFLDRIYIVKVPYCLRYEEEAKIYTKMLENSELKTAPCAPETISLLAQWSVLTRLKEYDGTPLYSKLKVYNGENIKDIDPKARSMSELKEAAGNDEGMSGISTRFAFKILSKTFNFDPSEVAADPIHLMYILEQTIKQSDFDEETEKKYLEYIKEYIVRKYADFIGNEIQKAYLESYSEYGQNLFDRYIEYADCWIDENDFKDPDTGQIYDREFLNKELEKIEKPAGIANPKDFRNEVVKFILKARAANGGKNPSWTSYEKLREVIEKKMFSSTDELLPVISFGTKKDGTLEKKHEDFVKRMEERGYTLKQTKRLVEWYMRVSKSN